MDVSEQLISKRLTKAQSKLFTLPGFRFSPFQFGLTALSSFNGVCSRLKIGFLKEVAPAFVPICRVLGILKRLQL